MSSIPLGKRCVFAWVGVAVFAASVFPGVAHSQAPAPRVPTAAASQKALVDQYCVLCHNQKALTAGLSLEGIDFSNPGASASVLERVLRKIRTGEMPPAGLPHPAVAASAEFVKTVEEGLDRAAATNPNPGRPAVHRLNRAEYSNAIRDVLALDVQPGSS